MGGRWMIINAGQSLMKSYYELMKEDIEDACVCVRWMGVLMNSRMGLIGSWDGTRGNNYGKM